MKDSLEELQCIYNQLEDKNEIAIVKKYGNNAARITVIITCKTKFLNILYTLQSRIDHNLDN